jgi:tetratricopeptide (TPR) repeat protein
VLAAAFIASGPVPPTLLELLLEYSAGRHEQAVAAAAAMEDLGPLRVRFVQDVPAWVAAESALADTRRRAAASFLLELAQARLESDWARFSDLIEWTCLQLRTAPPDDFERAWQRASVALAGRARERVWLLGEFSWLPQQTPPRRIATAKDPSPAHLMHALDRFPDDAQLRLARIVAWSWGRDAEPARNAGAVMAMVSSRRRIAQSDAITALEALVDDRDVGAEAHLRIGQLRLAMGDHSAALQSFEAAQVAASDPAVRFLGHFLAGRALEAIAQLPAARRQYEHALDVMPGAESAAVALASLRFVQDDRAAAVALFQQTFAQASREDDPGRLVGYGSFMHWPRLRDAMRAELAR